MQRLWPGKLPFDLWQKMIPALTVVDPSEDGKRPIQNIDQARSQHERRSGGGQGESGFKACDLVEAALSTEKHGKKAKKRKPLIPPRSPSEPLVRDYSLHFNLIPVQ